MGGVTGLQELDPFDYSQYPDEDTGTPDFVAYHAQQLQQCGVHVGPGGFRVHDLHKETLYHIEVNGKHYSGGVVRRSGASCRNAFICWINVAHWL